MPVKLLGLGHLGVTEKEGAFVVAMSQAPSRLVFCMSASLTFTGHFRLRARVRRRTAAEDPILSRRGAARFLCATGGCTGLRPRRLSNSPAVGNPEAVCADHACVFLGRSMNGPDMQNWGGGWSHCLGGQRESVMRCDTGAVTLRLASYFPSQRDVAARSLANRTRAAAIYRGTQRCAPRSLPSPPDPHF